MVAPTCKHCEKSKVNRPRGLCWGCYYTPGVRDMYPSTSKYARRGVGNTPAGFDEPDRPTAHAPGTPGKLAVLEERAKDSRRLWHPFDARYEGDTLPRRFTADPFTPLALDILEVDMLSDRGIYARPLAAEDTVDAGANGVSELRTVLLVVPGKLVYLTPAEALLLAGQLRGAAEQERPDRER